MSKKLNSPIYPNLAQLLSELAQLYQDRYVAFSDLENFKSTHYLINDTSRQPNQSNQSNQPNQPSRHSKPLTILTRSILRHYRYRTLLHRDWSSFRQLTQLATYLCHRDKLNSAFIQRAQQQTFRLENSQLDRHQIAAVVANEDASLILAPAGSGKTATLLSKVNYLITHEHIPPERILVIAFTNKVVAELKDRLCNDAVEIRTFHSFGNKIIKSHYPDHKLISEEASETLLKRIIQHLQITNPIYATQYQTFLSGEVTPHSFLRPKSIDPEVFEELITSAISLQKSERLTLAELRERIQAISDSTRQHEARQLFALYTPIFHAYTGYLATHHLYDFSDMLNLSTDFIQTLPAGFFAYQYILVDEAQDLSNSKSELLRATLAKCQDAKLFAVGDDWQSIYRFAGSNLKVLDDFEKFFARHTYRGLIELTYRFGQPTAKISNHFITKNPHQSKKRVTPAVKKSTPIEFAFYSTRKPTAKTPYFYQSHQPTSATPSGRNITPGQRLHTPSNSPDQNPHPNSPSPTPHTNHADQNSRIPPDYATVNQKLHELLAEYGRELHRKSLQIISRFNRDVFRLVDTRTHYFGNATYDSRTTTLKWRVAGEVFSIPYCTIHKAKGITRDIVFVINLNEGSMPATRDGNPMLETMLTELDDYPFAEERRLFYVAITRAKERTILVADRAKVSPFVFEILPKKLQK